MVDGTTANSLAADCRGPQQVDQVAKTKLLTRSRLRILDQGLGPTRARSSRNRPLGQPGTIAGLTQGWAGHPYHSRPMRLTSTTNTRSGRGRVRLDHALVESESLSFIR